LTPYYQQDGMTIFLGDCREVIDQWEGLRTQSFDLLLTDPPYGILAETGSAATRRSGGNTNNGHMEWDIAPSPETIQRLRTISRAQMIWGGCHLCLPPTFGYLVWDKQIDGLNFGECEMCWTSLRFAPRIFRFRAVGVDGGKQHPTQKPEALIRWALLQAPESVKTVLDPFMGSGTTLVACKRLGRSCVGIEREERYCEIAARRLQQGALTAMYDVKPEAAAAALQAHQRDAGHQREREEPR
jgi:16S rRNA G966 N2-methylase RsmD